MTNPPNTDPPKQGGSHMAHEQRPRTLKANIKQVANRSAGGTK